MEENNIESGPEKIPTKEIVLESIVSHAENAIVTREIFDDKGLYWLEAKVEGETKGEFTEFTYIRKGTYPQGASLETSIHKVYYMDDMPVGGDKVSEFDENSGEFLNV